MTRTTAVLVLLVLACAAGGAAAAGARADARDDYRAYAIVRERMKSCALDRVWRHLGPDGRRRCARLRRLYVYFTFPGEQAGHIHCVTRRCPPTPPGAIDPREPIPGGAHVYR